MHSQFGQILTIILLGLSSVLLVLLVEMGVSVWRQTYADRCLRESQEAKESRYWRGWFLDMHAQIWAAEQMIQDDFERIRQLNRTHGHPQSWDFLSNQFYQIHRAAIDRYRQQREEMVKLYNHESSPSRSGRWCPAILPRQLPEQLAA